MLEPLLEINAKNSRQAAEGFVEKLSSNSGKNRTSKSAVEVSAGMTQQPGTGEIISGADAIQELASIDPAMAGLRTELMDIQAAAKFTPFIRDGFGQFGLIGFASSGLAGNTEAAAIMAGTMTATSPRLAAKGAEIAAQANKRAINAMNFMRMQGSKGMEKIVQNEELVARLLRSGFIAQSDDELIADGMNTVLQGRQSEQDF